MILTILVFILILTVLVLIHELGHFFVAKKLGIKVEEFGFGFPPKIYGWKKGETIYSINALPIGGFVKLYGEDEVPRSGISLRETAIKIKDKSKAFYARPAWQKTLVVVAGVFMNFLLSVAIISFLFAFVGVAVPGDKVVISQIVKSSPADLAGLKPGDEIEYVNSDKVSSTSQLIEDTKKYLGKQITLKINSKGVERNISIVPRTNYPKGEGPMGVAVSQNFSIKKYSWYEAPIAGTKEALDRSLLIIKGLGLVLGQLISSGKIPEGSVAGPIGIAQLTGQVAQVGPVAILNLISFLSLNLAILNILPVPALDGGRLFFILTEMITRKKVHPKFESYAHALGMAFLLALVAAVTLHDILRILSGQPILPRP